MSYHETIRAACIAMNLTESEIAGALRYAPDGRSKRGLYAAKLYRQILASMVAR